MKFWMGEKYTGSRTSVHLENEKKESCRVEEITKIQCTDPVQLSVFFCQIEPSTLWRTVKQQVRVLRGLVDYVMMGISRR